MSPPGCPIKTCHALLFSTLADPLTPQGPHGKPRSFTNLLPHKLLHTSFLAPSSPCLYLPNVGGCGTQPWELFCTCGPRWAPSRSATLHATSYTGDIVYWHHCATASKLQPLPSELSRASAICHGQNHTSDVPPKSALPRYRAAPPFSCSGPQTLEPSSTFVPIPHLGLTAPPPKLSTI